MPLAAGDPAGIGDYRLLGRLGSGGMGIVYLAIDAAGNKVALKTVRAEMAHEPGFRERFWREVAVMRAVESHHTAPVVDAGSHSGLPFLVTEFVDGPSLAQRISSQGPLPGPELAQVARELAAALVSLHAAGVIHRDLKPSNVLLGAGGVKVIDFGIARLADATALTGTGLVVGTAGYLAPEQVLGAAEPASDVFSWACTVAHAATGRHPFGTGPAEAVLYRVVHTAPDIDGLPSPLAQVVLAAFSKDPAHRPSATALVDILDDILDGNHAPTALATLTDRPRRTSTPPPSPIPGARRRRRTVLATGVVAIAAAAIWGVLSSIDHGPSTTGSSPPSTRSATPRTGPSTNKPARTNVVLFEPWGLGYKPGSDVTVTQHSHGQCIGSSNVLYRDDAVRCQDDQSIRDPCFLSPSGSGTNDVLCSEDSNLHKVLRLTMDQPLPQNSSARPSASPGTPQTFLELELTDGQRCTFLQGATVTVAGKRANYGCDKGGALYGDPDTTNSPWTIDYQQNPGGSELQQATIATAYH